MRVKMNQSVRWSNGDVSTPRQMLDKGLAEVKRISGFSATSKGKPRNATFIDLIGTQSGVEVSGYVEE